MNCKSGDLAVIVRSHDVRNVGKLVKVHDIYHGRAHSWWVSCESVLHGIYSDWPPGAQVGQYDRNLRPIRDPGDDAKDEMLRPLPQEVCA